MRLRYTILYVENVRESLRFYEQAFGLATRFLHESGDYGELETGGTALAFSSRQLMSVLGKSPARANPDAPVFEIAFEVDDVFASFKRAVEAGAAVSQSPRDESWGQTTSYVIDPDGYLVELCSPVRA